jgi:hypothetical protein
MRAIAVPRPLDYWRYGLFPTGIDLGPVHPFQVPRNPTRTGGGCSGRQLHGDNGAEPGATCTRALLPSGTVAEVLRLDKGCGGRKPTDDELDGWIATLPVAPDSGPHSILRAAFSRLR